MIDFSNCIVLVVGDVMLDRFVHGKVNRISPEAPIPVLKVEKKISKLGGAANVAKNLKDLGCHVILSSVIGDDAVGREFTGLIQESGIIDNFILDNTRPTIVKTRFLSDNHHILRSDEEDNSDISENIEKKLIKKIKNIISKVDVVVLSDYNKGVLTEKVLHKILELNNSIPIIVDPKKSSFKFYKGATIITPNVSELLHATKTSDINSGIETALNQSKADGILLTRSENGMSYFQKDGLEYHLPTFAKNVVDVCGAGDTVVATLSACLAKKMSVPDAMYMANQAAAIVVSKLGTETASVLELEAQQYTTQNILEIKQAKRLVELWKSQNLKVGFTNGCFDIIHPGHVTMLQKCKDNCDKLIVGLNSDKSVKRLKGEARPVQNEISRATVLAGLSSVDLIVIFDENTPFELLEQLRPNVLMKGGDYKIENVVGRDLVEEVKIINFEEGHSTTNIIKKLTKK